MITLAKGPEVDRRSNTKTGIAKGWTTVIRDSFSLAGLQMQLIKLDSKEWLGRTASTLGALVFGAALVLGAIPILLAAAVIGLTLTELDLIWALLMVGGVVLIIGALLVKWAKSRLQNSFEVFERSKTEMENNLTWLKEKFSKQQD